jgi:hypothetical protein
VSVSDVCFSVSVARGQTGIRHARARALRGRGAWCLVLCRVLWSLSLVDWPPRAAPPAAGSALFLLRLPGWQLHPADGLRADGRWEQLRVREQQLLRAGAGAGAVAGGVLKFLGFGPLSSCAAFLALALLAGVRVRRAPLRRVQWRGGGGGVSVSVSWRERACASSRRERARRDASGKEIHQRGACIL